MTGDLITYGIGLLGGLTPGALRLVLALRRRKAPPVAPLDLSKYTA